MMSTTKLFTNIKPLHLTETFERATMAKSPKKEKKELSGFFSLFFAKDCLNVCFQVAGSVVGIFLITE